MEIVLLNAHVNWLSPSSRFCHSSLTPLRICAIDSYWRESSTTSHNVVQSNLRPNKLKLRPIEIRVVLYFGYLHHPHNVAITQYLL